MSSRTNATLATRLFAGFFALVCVLQPATLAHVPCAAIAFFAPEKCCCLALQRAASAHTAKPSCCASSQAEQVARAAHASNSTSVSASLDCGCKAQSAPASSSLAPVIDPRRGSADRVERITRWIAHGALVSQSFPCSPWTHDSRATATSCARWSPDLDVRSGAHASSQLIGCARRSLLSGGSRRFLIVLCTALL